MRSVTSAYREKVNSGEALHLKANLFSADLETMIALSEDRFMEGATFTGGSCPSGEFTVGGCVISSFRFVLNNWSGTFDDFDFAGSFIEPYLGHTSGSFVDNDDQIKIGRYYIASHKTYGHTIACVAYDALKLMDQTPLSLTYPITAADAVEAIADNHGMSVTGTIPSITLTDPGEDMTERLALSYISALCGKFVSITPNNYISFKWYDGTALEKETIFSEEIELADITITGVKHGSTMTGTDGYVIDLSDNPFITSANVTSVLQNAGSVIGTSFRSGNVSILADPSIEEGDLITFESQAGETVTMPVTTYVYKLGVSEEVGCDAETPEELDLRVSAYTVARNAQGAADEANANALQAGQPNISPFYARVPYAVGEYWTGWSGTLNNPLKLTPLSDGWVHVKYDNRSGSAISRCDEQMVRSDMVKAGADYTFLIEVRNNTSTGTSDFYIVQTDNCQFWGSGIKKNLEGNNTTSTSTDFSASNVARDGSIYYKRFVKTSEATGSSHWTGAVNRLCSLTFRAGAGVLAEYDIRVSLYEGEYWGPYKPYVDYGLREEVENLEVGGRNLLLGTGEPVEKTIALNASNYMTIDTYQTVAPVPNLFGEGDYLTISFDWETTATSGYFRVECGTVTPYVWGQVVKATGGRSPNTQYVDFASDNTSGHFEIVYKVTSAVASATSSLKWLRIRIDGAATSGKTFKISNAKVERGKNASDWTPAPEDIDADITAVETIAQNALTSANGKNTVFYALEDDPPTANGEDDTWFVLNTGGDVIAIKQWNGTAWVDRASSVDSFEAASMIIPYLDVYSLTAAQVQSLFGTFKGIRSFAQDENDDPVSYWDLETGKFHTVDGEFTGDIEGSNITGSKLRTTADHLTVIESTPASGAFDDTGVYTSGDAYIEVDAAGMYSIPVSAPTTKRSKLQQARFKIISGGSTSYFWGWYAAPMLAAERLFMSTGEAISGYKVLELINAVSSPATGVTGVSGVVWGRFATLFFSSFSYDPSVVSLTQYTLNAAYVPELRLDLKDTLNDVRFYIYSASDNSQTTPAGCIKPVSTLTSTKAFRGTFTYIRANNMASSLI